MVSGAAIYLALRPNALSPVARQGAFLVLLAFMIIAISFLARAWLADLRSHTVDFLFSVPLWIGCLWWIISELKRCRQGLK